MADTALNLGRGGPRVLVLTLSYRPRPNVISYANRLCRRGVDVHLVVRYATTVASLPLDDRVQVYAVAKSERRGFQYRLRRFFSFNDRLARAIRGLFVRWDIYLRPWFIGVTRFRGLPDFGPVACIVAGDESSIPLATRIARRRYPSAVATTALDLEYVDRLTGSPQAVTQEPIAGVAWARLNRDLRLLPRLPYTALPYSAETVTPLDELGKVDAHGVLDHRRSGRRHFHPVHTSQFALLALANWDLTKESGYLESAAANMDALLERAENTDFGVFLPYTFDFALHSDRNNVIRAPWYSAMAQGQALSVLSRLYEATNEDLWLDRAYDVFRPLATVYRFDQVMTRMQPWVSFVDSEGYLWLEEYAGGGVEPMRVLNGHVFAIFGLYDYWRVSRSAEVVPLLQGALATVEHYVPRLRVKGEPSWYGMRIQDNPIAQSPKYHRIHIEQLRALEEMVGAGVFAELADQLAEDFS